MFDPAQYESGARKMITTLATRLVLAWELLVRRAARSMNWNSMAALVPQAYLVPQQVAGIGRRKGRGVGARGQRT
jgi:hypothetical protein